jgi:hypothetical protein
MLGGLDMNGNWEGGVTAAGEGFLERFRRALVAAFSEIGPDRVREAWQSSGKRTRLYRDHLVPSLVKSLDLQSDHEWQTVDWVFRAQGVDLPVLLMESENEPWRVIEELDKYCRRVDSQAELKAILTVCPWDESVWGRDTCPRQVLLSAWKVLAREWLQVSVAETTIVVYVAEIHQSRFRLYEEIVAGPGTVPGVGPLKTILESTLASALPS